LKIKKSTKEPNRVLRINSNSKSLISCKGLRTNGPDLGITVGATSANLVDKAHAKARNLELEGDLNIDDRLVVDLIAACRSVAEKLELLAPISSP